MSRSSNKTPAKGREAMKQSKKKEEKAPKKTLSELCDQRIKTIHSEKRERDEQALRVKHKAQEDEMMAMIHGPNWRQKELPGDIPPPERYRQTANENDVKYLPEAANRTIRLKAS